MANKCKSICIKKNELDYHCLGIKLKIQWDHWVSNRCTKLINRKRIMKEKRRILAKFKIRKRGLCRAGGITFWLLQ